MNLPPLISIYEAVERYEGILLDAFGVIIQGYHATKGALEFMAHLEKKQKPYMIVTNGSLFNREMTSEKYAARGFSIPPEKIVTSGTCTAAWLKQTYKNMGSKKYVMIGPPSSYFIVEEAGGKICDFSDDFDGLIIGNQTGFPFLETMDLAITALFRQIDAGRNVDLLLPNPDLLYPDINQKFGITSGMIALILEQALEVRYPGRGLRFHKIGKPYPPIFEEAKRQIHVSKVLMVGDQIGTDIKGALQCNLECALIGTGISNIHDPQIYSEFTPTYRIENLFHVRGSQSAGVS